MGARRLRHRPRRVVGETRGERVADRHGVGSVGVHEARELEMMELLGSHQAGLGEQDAEGSAPWA